MNFSGSSWKCGCWDYGLHRTPRTAAQFRPEKAPRKEMSPVFLLLLISFQGLVLWWLIHSILQRQACTGTASWHNWTEWGLWTPAWCSNLNSRPESPRLRTSLCHQADLAPMTLFHPNLRPSQGCCEDKLAGGKKYGLDVSRTSFSALLQLPSHIVFVPAGPTTTSTVFFLVDKGDPSFLFHSLKSWLDPILRSLPWAPWRKDGIFFFKKSCEIDMRHSQSLAPPTPAIHGSGPI